MKKNKVVPFNFTSEHNGLILQRSNSYQSSDDQTQSIDSYQVKNDDDIEKQQQVGPQKIKSAFAPPQTPKVNLTAQDEFDKDQIPPNLDIALKHQKASQVGPIDFQQLNFQNEKEGICPCCSRTIYRSKLSLSSNNAQLSHLGVGITLYFNFTKFTIFLTLIIFLTSGLYNLITNIYRGENCSSSFQAKQTICYRYICQSNWITIMTAGNKKNEASLLQNQELFNIFTVCVAVLCFQYFRYYIRKADAITYKVDNSAEDYTLLVKEIPVIKNPNYESYLQDLKIYLQQCLIEDLYTSISKINFCYNLVELQAIQKKKEDILKQKRAATKQRYIHGKYQPGFSISLLDQELEIVESQLTSLSKKFYDSNDEQTFSSKFTGWAFVSIEFAKYLYKPSDLILGTSKKLNYSGKKLQIQKPPAPTDVFWENLHIHNQSMRQLSIYIILVCLLFGCFLLVNYILKQQQTVKNSKKVFFYNNEVTLQIFGVLISVIINVMNMILEELCIFFTHFEKQKTRTEYYTSAIYKISLAQFIVSALIIFVSQMFYLGQGGSYFQKIFDKGGLVYNIQYLFITSTIMGSFLQFLNIPGVFKAIKRYFAVISCKNETNFSTQEQLHQLFENPEFDIIGKYSRQLKTIFLMAFYAPIIPACLPWVAFTLLLNYFLDKVGNVFFSVFVCDNNMLSLQGIYQFISCGIGLVNAILPMQLINKKLFDVAKATPNEQSYYQIEDKFITDYERENPATKLIAKQIIKDRIKEKKNKQSGNEDPNTPLSRFLNIKDDQTFEQTPSTRKRKRQNKMGSP